MQDTMHDIFDVEFAAEIEEAVTTKVWSELPQELVQKMVESAVNHIEMDELDPPPIIKRLRVLCQQESCSRQRQPRQKIKNGT